jgi:putative transposase
LAIRVAPKLKAIDLIDVLSTCSSCGAFPLTSAPTTDRSSSSQRQRRNGSRLSVPRPHTSSGASPWENGYIESFNAGLRNGLLNGEIFYTLREAQIVRHYNTIRPHASIGHNGQP